MAKGIKYTSYADRSGYGAAGIAYMQGLVNAGIPLTWQPFVFEQSGYVPWTCNHDPFVFK